MPAYVTYQLMQVSDKWWWCFGWHWWCMGLRVLTNDNDTRTCMKIVQYIDMECSLAFCDPRKKNSWSKWAICEIMSIHWECISNSKKEESDYIQQNCFCVEGSVVNIHGTCGPYPSHIAAVSYSPNLCTSFLKSVCTVSDQYCTPANCMGLDVHVQYWQLQGY